MQIFHLAQVAPQIPDLLFKGRFGFDFEMLPYAAEGISPKKSFNFFKAGLNQYLLPQSPLGKPVIAQVEPANFCNLECPLCLTTSITNSRPRALLPFQTFINFMDEVGDHLLLLIFWTWGEPFLNPDFFRMVAYAKSKGVVVHTSTNGNVPLTREKAEELVESGLDSLVVAVDGATQETYAKYRRGGRLETVIENIKTIQHVRKLKKSLVPRINMRFVVMQHNEAEMEATRNLARGLGVDYFTLKTVDMPIARGKDLDRTFAPDNLDYRRYAYDQKTFQRQPKPFTCMRPWKRITMDALGEIIPCEYDYKNDHSFGNEAELGALGAWKSAAACQFRKQFNLGHNNTYLCRNCTYKNSVADDCTVERFVIKQA
jgi:radical SAM protein with 4Fe4S-binding SPASM domain